MNNQNLIDTKTKESTYQKQKKSSAKSNLFENQQVTRKWISVILELIMICVIVSKFIMEIYVNQVM